MPSRKAKNRSYSRHARSSQLEPEVQKKKKEYEKPILKIDDDEEKKAEEEEELDFDLENTFVYAENTQVPVVATQNWRIFASTC